MGAETEVEGERPLEQPAIRRDIQQAGEQPVERGSLAQPYDRQTGVVRVAPKVRFERLPEGSSRGIPHGHELSLRA